MPTARIKAETIDDLDAADFDIDDDDDNLARAKYAARALGRFALDTGNGGEPTRELFVDLLTDLHHLADALGLDWDERVGMARTHYHSEV